MTPEEEKDLKEMKQAILNKKESCFSYLEVLDRAAPDDLIAWGYRCTNAEAMQKSFRSYQSDIKRLIAAHIKKYPD